MIPAERQHTILKLLRQHKILSISHLTELLRVSHMTIRRDLKKLENEGKINLTSGGVQISDRLLKEPNRYDKSFLFAEQKQAIGYIASEKIPTNSSIYLDAGTTALEIAKQIRHREDLLIITNDFIITEYLSDEGRSDLIHAGGSVNKDNHSSVGELTAQFLRQFSIDLAFISTSSWTLKGITTPDQNKIPVKRAIAQVANQRILISDSSKYGKIATFMALELQEIDEIICDNSLDKKIQNQILASEIKLTIAKI